MIPSTYTGEIYGSTSTTDTSSSSIDDSLGQDAFLTMFMAQVTNQNPLDPMDNTEFTAQLATFSQLEKLTQIAESMEGISDLQTSMDKSVALGYLGKEVTVSGNVMPVIDGEAGEMGFYLDYAAEAQAIITDENGVTVATVDLGTVAAGQNYFTWDATDDAGQAVEDGAYTITIEATSSVGETVDVYGQTITAKVTGYMDDGSGNVYLLLGDTAIAIDGVLAVNAPSDGETTEEDETEQEEAEESLSELEALAAKAEEDESSISTSDVVKALGSIGALTALLL
ncbi:flagellar hook capping protein [Desulfarculus baarsii DSM 2075]|uniref:Basal-body rod modification protein FlgD n=1 Tax=Desulfarculus baarsii (strain ATCC 33931 / DSM 2075 / LMG 7858 / VKM B-1802 / 2st14) TaxID=644282 RepID=E1QJC5_DESB2|nr:flagellar hook capping FlgD N-terminal domain-containing protein [Desulfarculus baarsii]ADK85668.1 flagellar hook capping protein [Desulfarculus baarsii DSM 2075]